MRREDRGGPARTSWFFAGLVAVAMVGTTTPALAQATIPFGSTLPPEAAPPPTAPVTPPPTTDPPAPPTDSAAPPAPAPAPIAPVTQPPGAPTAIPPPTTLAPEPAPLPPLALEQPAPPPTQRAPFYRKTWFWAAVGVVAVTAIVIGFAVSSSGSNAPPSTLGDMHAF